MDRHLALGLAFAVAACSTAERKTDGDARQNTDAAGSNMTDAALDDGATDAATDAAVDAASAVPCGNGSMDGGEACDDGNTASNDGCSSACALEPTQAVTMTALNLSVPDDGYNGSQASMACANVAVTAWYTPAIASATVTVGIDHTWAGDLVIKAIAPDNTVVTLVSRPGLVEASDDGTTSGGFGTGADLNKLYPITFATGATVSAETMGTSVSTICMGGADCMFVPNNGAAAANNLTAFNGKPSTGTWKLCVGDGSGGDTGKIDRVTFTFNH